MARTFHLQIITPDKIVYQGEVVSLVAPGEDGYLGILADHAPLISNVKSGRISITVDVAQPPKVFHSPGKGFLEVVQNKVTLLLRSLDTRPA